jgi:hypothetical protein
MGRVGLLEEREYKIEPGIVPNVSLSLPNT